MVALNQSSQHSMVALNQSSQHSMVALNQSSQHSMVALNQSSQHSINPHNTQSILTTLNGSTQSILTTVNQSSQHSMVALNQSSQHSINPHNTQSILTTLNQSSQHSINPHNTQWKHSINPYNTQSILTTLNGSTQSISTTRIALLFCPSLGKFLRRITYSNTICDRHSFAAAPALTTALNNIYSFNNGGQIEKARFAGMPQKCQEWSSIIARIPVHSNTVCRQQCLSLSLFLPIKISHDYYYYCCCPEIMMIVAGVFGREAVCSSRLLTQFPLCFFA